MHTVTLEEAQAHLPDLVRKAGRGEEIVIVENDKPVATLAAPPADELSKKTKGWPVIGMMAGGIEYRDGWDETPEGFEPYMQ